MEWLSLSLIVSNTFIISFHFQPWNIRKSTPFPSKEVGPHNLSQRNSYYCSKNLSYLSQENIIKCTRIKLVYSKKLSQMKQIFLLQIYPKKNDATVQNKLLCRWHSLPKGPVEERKRNISFELSQQNLTNSIVDKVTEGWSPNTEFGSNKFWVNFALFFSWCIFRVSFSLQLRIWCEGKDQTDKCHIHPFRKKLRAVFGLPGERVFGRCNLQCID